MWFRIVIEKEIECPSLQSTSVPMTSIKRKDLRQHLERKRNEHLELKLNAVETITEDLRLMVERQNKYM